MHCFGHSPRRCPSGPLAPALLVLVFLLAAPFSRASYQLVRNFTSENYGAGRQNWCIEQDALGRVYFGNTDGLLVTDSHRWDRYFISNYSTVRSVLPTGRGSFYAGGSEEFGIFEPDSLSGRLRYRSFMPMLGNRRPVNMGEIWHIHHWDSRNGRESVIFQGDHHIFHYNGRSLSVVQLPAKALVSAVIGNRLYIALEGMGLFRLNGRELEPVAGNSVLSDKRIVALLLIDNTVMVVTAFDGVYRLLDNGVQPMMLPITDFLRENQAFCAARSGRQYAFGTVNYGIVTYNIDNGTVSYSNANTGMQNNTVLSLFFDRTGNLWAGLDNGIAYILNNSPISSLSTNQSNIGAGYASCIFGTTLWLGTNQGLYSTPYPMKDTPVGIPFKQTLKGQVWALKKIGPSLFAACDAGLYFSNGNGVFNIVAGVPGTWNIEKVPQSIVNNSKNHDGTTPTGEYALASTYDRFYLLQNTPSGWVSLGPVEGYNDIGGRLAIDRYDNVWIAHWIKGLYRLHLDVGQRKFVETEFYNKQRGLPTNRNNIVCIVDGEPVISTEGGFYHYNHTNGKIEHVSELGKIFGFMASPLVYRPANNELLAVNLSTIRMATRDVSGNYDVDSVSFSPLIGKLIAGREDFNFISPRSAIVANMDGFYEVNLDHTTGSWNPGAFVSRVYSADSLIYTPSEMPRDSADLKLPYALNSLRFEFVSPEYRSHEVVEYSCMLENYDSDWSAWSTSNSKEYTQLHEGKYKLHVRSRNGYSQHNDEFTFPFEVQPPWYRSLPAKIIYAILLLVIGWCVYRLVREYSQKASRKMALQKEKELHEMQKAAREEALRKDYEIAALKSQQLEHDVKHKSEELSNITMNVVRKNELLLDISGMLSKIQEHPDYKDNRSPEVTRQFNKIQTVIRDNISHDDDWKDFTRNFDLAYDNYTQKLRQLHPSLTEADLRMCCYLRMGLSSKEIAPLLNISYRSVEMSRYRLRKKMNLSRDVNLTDYLQRL